MRATRTINPILVTLLIVVLVLGVVAASAVFLASNKVEKTTTVGGAPIQLSLSTTGSNAWSDVAYTGIAYDATVVLKANATMKNVSVLCNIYGADGNQSAVILYTTIGGEWVSNGVFDMGSYFEIEVQAGPFTIQAGETVEIPIQVGFNADGTYTLEFYAVGEQG